MTPALALGEFSFGCISTLPGDTVPWVPGKEAMWHLGAPCRTKTFPTAAFGVHRELRNMWTHKLGYRKGPYALSALQPNPNGSCPVSSLALNKAIH